MAIVGTSVKKTLGVELATARSVVSMMNLTLSLVSSLIRTLGWLAYGIALSRPAGSWRQLFWCFNSWLPSAFFKALSGGGGRVASSCLLLRSGLQM